MSGGRRSGRPRMTTFLRSLVVFTLIFHVPFFVAAAEAARRVNAPAPWAIAAVLTAVALGLFAGRARAGMPDRRRSGAIVRFVDVPYFVHWCACVFTIVPSLVAAISLLAADLARGRAPGAHGAVHLAIYAAGLLVCGWGILVRRRVFRVEEHDVRVVDLPAAFDGYRIAHLSDLHVGALTPRAWAERWTRAANARTPDLAVVTGDMVTSGVEFHEDIAIVVGSLQAKDGVVVSMGNHDYFGEGEPLVSLLCARGARVLRNEGFALERGAARVFVAGLDDTWTRRADMDRALAARPGGAPTILLAHDPEQFPAAAERGVELVLAGHTHGGQIAVPFLARRASLAHLAHRHVLGFYRRARSVMYVHPGLGTTGPPIRLGVAPAVVVLTLRPA